MAGPLSTAEQLAARFRDVAPPADFCSLRFVDELTEVISVRDGVPEPTQLRRDQGAMITVVSGGGLGYAATSDLTTAGLRRAAERAAAWASRTAAVSVVDFSAVPFESARGEYVTPVEQPWEECPLADKLSLLQQEVAAMGGDDRVVERVASLMRVRAESAYFTADGGMVRQRQELLAPDASVIVHRDGVTQKRTTGGRGLARQGGLEVLQATGFTGCGARLREQALELLAAPQCPTGRMDLVLAPDQMMLQIHESIGHPLELDRILGDERNYAGTSFVTLDMFGRYRYGSPLLNVSFDPTVPGEFASYGFDDDGARATRTLLIEAGRLLRPLGGTVSQHRARATHPAMSGVATTRACSWNRPPIDRMANLNLEPGDLSFDELIAPIERGVYMETNTSWSIDDSRNKFQFGCEYGRLIEDGRLGAVVRNPNYRGISATFWRSLAGVGDRSTFQVLGTPYCGKGEPNQVIRVGHAAPACRFTDVDVFGGAA
ncbi:MAG: TldD/PmbA family protein [Deltaproteobacteria bacterium]|nr:MAG: TldD/PmbA family protein [Deltaproteobacteria bacterium]